MFLKFRCYLHLFIFITTVFFSCNTNHDKTEIEDAMKKYDRLIKKVDADSIAMLYTIDGDLGKVAHGRDSIRKFLSSFKNIEVLSSVSQTDSVTISHDTAFQTGTYLQQDVVDKKDTVKVHGAFTAKWIWFSKKDG